MSTASTTLNNLNKALKEAFRKAMSDGLLPEAEIPPFNIETPSDRRHGDLATNAAMVSAKTFRSAPRKIAEALTQSIDLSGTNLSKFELI